MERISENAEVYQVSFQSELERVMIHGILHLLGYKDKDIEHKIEMTKKEDYYLAARREL